MSAPKPLHIPRASYGLTMAVVTTLGLGCAGSIAAIVGGDARAVGLVVGLLAISSVATLFPAVLHVGLEYWGILVLSCGTGRSLAVLAIAYLLSQSGTPARPLFLGAVSGAVLILILESGAAIRILSQIERRRAALQTTT